MNPQEARDLEVAKEHCEAQKYRSDFIASAGSFLAGISYARANPINPGVSSCDDEKDAEIVEAILEDLRDRSGLKWFFRSGDASFVGYEVLKEIKTAWLKILTGRRSAPPTDSSMNLGLVELLGEARGYVKNKVNGSWCMQSDVDLLARIDARLKGEK